MKMVFQVLDMAVNVREIRVVGSPSGLLIRKEIQMKSHF